MVEEDSGSVILLQCHWDPMMQDNCRGTGQEPAPQPRETKEGLREAALGPAALSMEVTPHHVNLTWIPASAAQPCDLFPPRDVHCSWMASSASTSLLGPLWPHSRRMASTPSCNTHQIPATALCRQGVTSYSRRGIREVCGV